MTRRPRHHPAQLVLLLFPAPVPAAAEEAAAEKEEKAWGDLVARLEAGDPGGDWRAGLARAWLAGRNGRGKKCDPRRVDAPGYVRLAAWSTRLDDHRWARRVGVGLLVLDEEEAA